MHEQMTRIRTNVARRGKSRADKRQTRDSLRAAKQPPVMKPEMIAFQASSFCRQPLTAQSNVENMPPQTPKLPPVTGARAFIVDMAPTRRSPYEGVREVGGGNEGHTRGEFRAPFTPCHMPPPTAPIAKAPPKSLRITHGLERTSVMPRRRSG
jgi:hypothetical protein